jgi:hypothetical protein
MMVMMMKMVMSMKINICEYYDYDDNHNSSKTS